MEILVIDGGSSDSTKSIATEYECRIIDNPATDPVSAKFLGLQHANGEYIITIDHDEVLANPRSIENRINALRGNPECKVAILSGYRCPKGYSGLNQYVSEFGDPFSLFYYRFSAGYKYYSHGYMKRASLVEDNPVYSIFKFDKGIRTFIIELVCFGTILDLNYFKSVLSADTEKNSITHLFYKMVQDGRDCVILSKNDPLDHYSIDSIGRYLPKLRWRIVNNIHYPDRASQGFNGRQYETGSSRIKKYLFPLYSASIILPVLDSIYLSLTRKNASFMWHPLLCLYVTSYILWQYLRKVFHCPPHPRTYDGKKTIQFMDSDV